MGVEAILAQDPRTSLGDGFPTFETNPRIACRDPVDRPAHLAGLVAWRKDYREALDAWRAGRRGRAFPLGSYWLPRFHGALLATGPPLAA